MKCAVLLMIAAVILAVESEKSGRATGGPAIQEQRMVSQPDMMIDTTPKTRRYHSYRRRGGGHAVIHSVNSRCRAGQQRDKNGKCHTAFHGSSASQDKHR